MEHLKNYDSFLNEGILDEAKIFANFAKNLFNNLKGILPSKTNLNDLKVPSKHKDEFIKKYGKKFTMKGLINFYRDFKSGAVISKSLVNWVKRNQNDNVIKNIMSKLNNIVPKNNLVSENEQDNSINWMVVIFIIVAFIISIVCYNDPATGIH